ncbi:hypothetical protein HGRIS_013934 [Hohenbuehelia grisea]|uniref:DUF5648 domain-containing protein n=1 Tax=Hohenbuehelia grisea TaxID=104357 RepID=A0ABR3JS05_9AGAR
MKFTFAILASALAAAVAALPAEPAASNAEAYAPCPDVTKAARLFRLYHSSSNNHFYTTSEVEANNAEKKLGYTREGSASFILPTASPHTTPLYRLWSVGASDHFYTTSNDEANSATKLGYTREGIAGHVYKSTNCGGRELFRFWNGAVSDHFYTTDKKEGLNAGYAFEGNMGFVLPFNPVQW